MIQSLFSGPAVQRSPALALSLVASALLLGACGSTASDSSSDPKGGNAMGGGPAVSFGQTPAPNAADLADCNDAAKLVYVVSEDKVLYSFAPDKLLFTKIGTLGCPDQNQ